MAMDNAGHLSVSQPMVQVVDRSAPAQNVFEQP